MLSDDNKLDKVEKLENRLYSASRNGISSARAKIHSIRRDLPNHWNEVKNPVPEAHVIAKTSKFFRKMFLISSGFLVVAIGVALFTIFYGSGGVSNENVDVNILGSTFTDGGETLSISVEAVNRNPVPLELVDLLIEYPRGASDTDDVVRIRESIGTISSGESVVVTKDVILFGEIGTERTIKATLEYRLSDSNAIFVKEAFFPVTINSSPLDISINGSATAVSGQEMTFDIVATSSARETLKNVLVKIEYPFGYTFVSSTPEPSYNTTSFYLGDFEPGESKKIKVVGKIEGGDNETRAFRIYVGEQDSVAQTEISVMYNSVLKTVTISKPFLDARIVYGGSVQSTYEASPNQTLPLQILWSNNLPSDITDAEIVATFGGNAIDMSSIKAQNSFYNSNTGELVWSKDTLGEFKRLEAGSSGTLALSLKSLPLYTSGKGVLTNPTITVSVSVRGNQFSQGVTGSQATSIATTTFKLSSDFQVSAKSTYKDGPFVNTGPLPPKVGAETTYTLTWTATNSSNALTDGYAKATLPLYVTWKNVISPTSENVSYNSATREVRWDFGSVSPATGYGTSARSVSFQVGLTPSTSQVGDPPELMGDTVSSAFDTYVGASLNRSWAGVSTRTVGDTGYSSGFADVVE